MQSILAVAERLIESTGPRAQIDDLVLIQRSPYLFDTECGHCLNDIPKQLHPPLRFVVLCLLQVHSADVKHHALCAWVRVSKTPLNVIQSVLVVAERLIESTVLCALINQY